MWARSRHHLWYAGGLDDDAGDDLEHESHSWVRQQIGNSDGGELTETEAGHDVGRKLIRR